MRGVIPVLLSVASTSRLKRERESCGVSCSESQVEVRGERGVPCQPRRAVAHESEQSGAESKAGQQIWPETKAYRSRRGTSIAAPKPAGL